MPRSVLTLFVAGICLITLVARASVPTDREKEEAIKKDRQLIAGTWTVTKLEINGNPGNEDDIRKIKVVNGPDGTWSLRVDDKEISKGTNTFDPTLKPKTIDFTPSEGEGKGNVYAGIYELGEKTRKLCFGPPEKARPTTFAAPAGSDYVYVTFEREPVK